MIYVLLMINIILMVTGQMLWKIGVRSMDDRFSIHGLFRIIINPYVISGLVLFAAATLIWFYILSKEDISKVYPIQSLSYAAAAVLSVIFFKESIPMTRWCGIFFIILGAYFVSIN